MNMKYLFVSLFLILNPFSANAFTFGDPLTNGEWFKEMGIKNVKIVIQDDIKDGCWTNLKEVREYTEEKLRIIGLKAVDETSSVTQADLNLAIIGVGQKTLTGCVGNGEAVIYYTQPIGGSSKRVTVTAIASRIITFYGNGNSKLNDGMIKLVNSLFVDWKDMN